MVKKAKAEWYVIQVVSGTEETVRTSLLQRKERFGLEDHILDVFVPMHDVISRKKSGEKVKTQKNIFPGYILVQMVVTNESWYIVRNTPNVTWFLWAWNIPVPVAWEELDRLKWVLKDKAQTYSTNFKEGDRAIIVDGPFEWNEWNITEVDEDKWLVKVNINLLGRDTPIELEFSQIKTN